MYTQIDNEGALNTHLQDEHFEYVILYFYMAPLQCCVDTLNAIQEVSKNPQTCRISFLAIDLNAPGLSGINDDFGITKVPELAVREPNNATNTRLTVGTSSDIFYVLQHYCGIVLTQ